MKLSHQRGFGTVGVVIAVVVLAVIGTAGWMVHNNSKKSDVSLNKTYGPDTQTPAVPVSDSAKPPVPSAGMDVEPNKTTFSKTPGALQSIIISYSKTKMPECVKGSTLIDIDGKTVDPDVTYTIHGKTGSAFVGLGCDGGGSQVLFGRNSDGNWVQVSATQFAFSCDDLKSVNVPVKLLEVAFAGQDSPTNCFDTSNNLVPYSI